MPFALPVSSSALLLPCLGLLLCCGACRPPAQHDYYDFDFQKPLDAPQLLFRSSTVVVGVVQSISKLQEGLSARRDPHFLLDQIRARVLVENVLRGDIRPGALDVEFFTPSLKNGLGITGPGWLMVEPGERQLLFLTQDAGIYRSVADVRGDYAWRIFSGRHRALQWKTESGDAAFRPSGDRAIGNGIAEVLLTPGEGYNENAMRSSLFQDAFLSSQLSSRPFVAQLLKHLIQNTADPPLAAAACLTLAEQYDGQGACLETFRDDPRLSTEMKDVVQQLATKRQTWDAQFKQRLRTAPMLAFFTAAHPDSVSAVQSELKMLVEVPDQELRKLACQTLQHEYGESHRSCHD